MTSPDESPSTPSLAVRFWGTRGSIPAPGPDTVRYGGNTSCIEITAGDQHLVFDAGTGARALGLDLSERGERVDTTLFLTHFHWDHIQGIPFFKPLYDPDATLHIVGPTQTTPDGRELEVQSLFAGQMRRVHFPLPMSAISAACSFGHLNEGTWEQKGVRVRSMRVKHDAFTVGYRVDFAGRSVAYVPDNELASDTYPVGPGWRERFVEFIGGVDVLVHDAMYTEEEYPRRRRWGHSTFEQALDLGREAGVGELVFFHHDPIRTDDDLDDLVGAARGVEGAAGRSERLRAAAEGEEILLPASTS